MAYLSAEFLLGPHLANNILNLKLGDKVREAVSALGLDLEAILDAEQEPGLGNGGLGRLGACYMDSLATLEIPAIGYGIRYEYGIFEQSSGTAGRSKWPTRGCDTAIPGSCRDSGAIR